MKTYLQRFTEARQGLFACNLMNIMEGICKDADWKCTFLKNDNERLHNLLIELNRDVKSLKNEIRDVKESKNIACYYLQKADNQIKDLKSEIEALKEQNAVLLGELSNKTIDCNVQIKDSKAFINFVNDIRTAILKFTQS